MGAYGKSISLVMADVADLSMLKMRLFCSSSRRVTKGTDIVTHAFSASTKGGRGRKVSVTLGSV